MADVFVSYSSNDRETVALITAGLTRSGFDVWWDQRLLERLDQRFGILDRVRKEMASASKSE